MPELSPRFLALTFLGGALGSALRWVVGDFAQIGVQLFVVNLLGALAVGFFHSHRMFASAAQKSFWIYGFAGGFTTLSGLALWQFYGDFSWLAVALQLVAGIGLYFVGNWLGALLSEKAAK